MSDSSPAIAAEAATLNPDSISDVNAVSSTVADQGVEKSPTELVFEALGVDSEESSPGSERDPKDPVEPTEGEAAKAGEPDEKPPEPLGEVTEEELKKYGPKTQARIRQLLDERLEKHKELEAVRPKAQQFDAIMRYAETSNLSNEDVGNVLELGALVRNDPDAAYDRLMPILQQLAQVTGRVLPDDVQERVRLGYISEEDAKRLARSESQAKLSQQRVQQTTEERQQETERQRILDLQQTSQTAADKWESARKASDPDWPLKQERVAELVKLEVFEKGFPTSSATIVEMLDRIHARVTTEYARFNPRPKAIAPVIGTASTQARSEPKSSQEAAMRVLGFAD